MKKLKQAHWVYRSAITGKYVSKDYAEQHRPFVQSSGRPTPKQKWIDGRDYYPSQA